jgi:hypothetical protein
MITEIKYTNINQILDEVHRHPLMRDVTLEQVVSYLVTFLGLYGLPDMYIDKEELIHIEDYRALLPCDLVSITQVKDCKSSRCMRSMTDNFLSKEEIRQENTFKTQGTVIYTSFKKGDILIAYRAIPLDENGFPKLIDNPVFLDTFRLFIKKEVFTILFDLGKISQQSLQNVQQEYSWRAGQLNSEFTIPNESEMESITRMWNTLIPRMREFDKGFKNLGNREYIKQQ